MAADPLRWLPFGILPSDQASGRPEPELIEMALPPKESDWLQALQDETVVTQGAWTIHDVMSRFADRALTWHASRAQSRKNRRAASLSEMREWIASTRALSARLPFRAELESVRAMQAAADRLDRVLGSWSGYFTSWPPSLGTQAHSDRLVTLNLWAMDHFVRAVNEAEADHAQTRNGRYLSVTLGAIWPAMFGDVNDPPVWSDYHEAEKRIARLRPRIIEGRTDALMVAMLTDVLHDPAYPATPPK